ncbi:MAG TPA: YitT family protein [Bacteroidales bacterium]|nr:YitT family protein [Bacteroidales bacterium]
MAYIVRYKFLSWPWLKAYALIVSGAFIIAAGYVLFITPHRIVPGGIYGISIMLHHTFGTPVGLMAIFFNVPLTIMGLKVLGPRFGAKTFTGFIFTSGFIDGLNWLTEGKPMVEDDVLLSSLYGGAVIGLGVGMLFKAKATCGGTDVMAMMLGKWTGMPLGRLMMMVDGVIVVLGAVVFQDWAIPLYSLVAIFMMGQVIDLVMQGLRYDKLVLLISDNQPEIASFIIGELQRGATMISANGMFSGADRPIIYVVLNRREVAMLQEFVARSDPKAFLTVIEADEILGEGFRPLRAKFED